jgi:F-type H+-transporting ATPase subunit gamma
MASGKEIRTKIKSVENTRKITKAMEMVSVSKMRKAQERMRAARPYGEKIRRVAANLSHALSEYKHPFLMKRDPVQSVGLILVTSDKGLCGGLNSNILRMSLVQDEGPRQLRARSYRRPASATRALGFMQRVGAKVRFQRHRLWVTRPTWRKLIGPVKVQLDAYLKGEIDALYIGYTRFINTMKQEPVIETAAPAVRRSCRVCQDQVGLCLRTGFQVRHRRSADPLRRSFDLSGRG